MEIDEAGAFLNMFASIDYMRCEWKNCPIAWQGNFGNKNQNRSIILKVTIDQSLWIWHVFFGLLGVNNDVNGLDRSPFILDFIRGEDVGLILVVVPFFKL
jgi:hypothetical protein